MASMNQVSDLNLALAGHHAGIFPSLSLFNYWKDNEFKFDDLERDLDTFTRITSTTNLLISLIPNHLFSQKILEMLVEKNFLNIEIVDGLDFSSIPKVQKIRKDLKHRGMCVFLKAISPKLIMETDVLILKGNEGAGKFLDNKYTLKELFEFASNAFPSLPIIPSGGIKNSDDVKYYINRNAYAVAIGSLFAFSKDSKISDETKNKVMNLSSAHLSNIKNRNQNGIVFEEIENDNENNTVSLKLGIETSAKGHIFVGKSIDSIVSIKTVKELVDDLVSKI